MIGLVQSESVKRDDFFPSQLIGGAPAHDRQHIALLDDGATPRPNSATCVNLDRGQPLVNYSEQRLGSGCGASAVSITRRLLAPSPSFDGGRMLPVTNYGSALAAPVAEAKVQRSSTQAGQAIILASSRFQ